MNLSKIVLGTAQLGFNYGHFNQSKIQNSKKKAKKILEKAFHLGIRSFDSASDYGDSEKRIGSLRKKILSKIKITSKTPNRLPEIYKNKINHWLKRSLNNSLNNLSVSKIENYIIHNPKHINLLRKINLENKFKKLGVSIDNVKELKNVMRNDSIKIIQIPFNILDWRWRKNNLLERVNKKNKKIYVRSVLLQGLLVNDKKKWPISLKKYYKKTQKDINFFVKQFNRLNALDLCIAYVKSRKNIHKIIIGVDNINQLVTLSHLFKRKNLNKKQINLIEKKFQYHQQKILTPGKW